VAKLLQYAGEWIAEVEGRGGEHIAEKVFRSSKTHLME